MNLYKTTKVFYLSSWIANLGVVPLFLLAAFLFAPIFFLLFLRIIFVCLVFDAIILSCYSLSNKIGNVFLTVFPIKVKGLILTSLLLCSLTIKASQKTIKFIEKGEQISFRMGKKSQFSLGNKRVLGSKYLKKNNLLLIKGLKKGLSDLFIWKDKKKTSYKIYVVDQATQSASLNLLSFLDQNRLEYEFSGSHLSLKKNLLSLPLFQAITQLCHKAEKINCQLPLHKKLQTKIITRVYQTFLQHQQSSLYCSYEEFSIFCSYLANKRLNFHKKLKAITKKWGVHFSPITIKQNHNFKIRFKIFQLETQNSQQTQLGLHYLESQLGNLSQIIDNNTLSLKDQSFKAKLLAEPETITTLDTPNTIKIGEDQPFQSHITNNQNSHSSLQWKFAGFKLKFTLSYKEQQLMTHYQISLSSHQEGGVKGSYKSSALKVHLGQPTFVFKINLQSKDHTHLKTPFFSKLPIIGKAFRGQGKNQGQKLLIGYIHITDMEQE